MPVQYPVTTMHRARQLRDEGLTLDQVVVQLERETGRRPTRETVHRWVNPKVQSRIYAANRRRDATGRLRPRSVVSAEFKIARVLALRARGLSKEAIAQVIEFDLGDRLTVPQIEYALEVGRYPRRTNLRPTGQPATHPVP